MLRDFHVDSESIGYTQKIRVVLHAFQADESADHSGTDAGPSPEELLLAALGACAGMTVQMYAERKRQRCMSICRTLPPAGHLPLSTGLKLLFPSMEICRTISDADL
jgi:hypothetical protein